MTTAGPGDDQPRPPDWSSPDTPASVPPLDGSPPPADGEEPTPAAGETAWTGETARTGEAPTGTDGGAAGVPPSGRQSVVRDRRVWVIFGVVGAVLVCCCSVVVGAVLAWGVGLFDADRPVDRERNGLHQPAETPNR